MASIEDLQKIEIRIGLVTSAEKLENSDKLIKLSVDFGNEQRTILTAMAEYYSPEHFVNKKLPFITNLDYRTIRGVESQGMILAADTENGPVLLLPEKDLTEGSKVI